MIIPLYYLFDLYVVFAALAGVLFLFNVYHIVRFGMQSPKTTIVIASYIVSFVFVSASTLSVLSTFQWNDRLEIVAPFEIHIVTDGLTL